MSSDAPPADRYPSQPSHVTALDLPLPPRESLPPDLQKYFRICDEKIGFLPNVLAAYTFDEKKLRAFIGFYNELMLEDSPLSKLEREMIAVVVSSANRCYYCQVAHGQAVRELSGDPALGELLVMNYRAAALTPRQRAMLDFAHKMTVTPARSSPRTVPRCATRGSTIARSGTSPRWLHSSTCRTAWRPRST